MCCTFASVKKSADDAINPIAPITAKINDHPIKHDWKMKKNMRLSYTEVNKKTHQKSYLHVPVTTYLCYPKLRKWLHLSSHKSLRPIVKIQCSNETNFNKTYNRVFRENVDFLPWLIWQRIFDQVRHKGRKTLPIQSQLKTLWNTMCRKIVSQL